jgi:hypothetical protein
MHAAVDSVRANVFEIVATQAAQAVTGEMSVANAVREAGRNLVSDAANGGVRGRERPERSGRPLNE